MEMVDVNGRVAEDGVFGKGWQDASPRDVDRPLLLKVDTIA